MLTIVGTVQFLHSIFSNVFWDKETAKNSKVTENDSSRKIQVDIEVDRLGSFRWTLEYYCAVHPLAHNDSLLFDDGDFRHCEYSRRHIQSADRDAFNSHRYVTHGHVFASGVPSLQNVFPHGWVTRYRDWKYKYVNVFKYHHKIIFIWSLIGSRKEENAVIYVGAEQQTSTATTKFIYCLISIPVVSSSPFLVAAYHWCVGKYTIDSWFFFFPVW